MLTTPSPRRNIPVRLCDIPEPVRMNAARELCRQEPDPDVRLAIVLAAVAPSERVYFVAAEGRAA